MRMMVVLVACLWLGSGVRAADLPDPARFLHAIETGDLRSARNWLEKGLPADFEASEIGTGLMIGAWEGNLPMMELFHRYGADLNRSNRLGEQALQLAAWRGRLEAVRWLVERGAEVSRQGLVWSALHYAVFAGHDAVVDFLLARGADVNGLSTNGSTPLMMAAREGHEAIAGRLLRAGADPDIVNEQGENAVHWAMRQGNLSIAKAIGGAERFAAAASRPPPAWGEPTRSQPLPDRAQAIMAQARRMEGEGRRDEAFQLYRAALAEIRRADATRKIPPAVTRVAAGMVITAKRGNPEAQSASIRYAAPAGTPGQNVGAGETAPKTVDDASDEWLRRARAAEAAGKRKEALHAYRNAAASLRAARAAASRASAAVSAAQAPVP